MMTEKYPTWLIGHVKEWAEKRLPTVILCSTTGNELLEVWYYGDLHTVKGEPQSYIIDSDEAPGLVTARDPESGEEFVIFDGGRHGYDNMFCDEHDPSELEHRPLKRYEIPASKLVLELGYSVVSVANGLIRNGEVSDTCAVNTIISCQRASLLSGFRGR